MGALVAEIAAAFVLLVAGAHARAVAQPLWRRFVHWWHTEGNEPVEFRFMDRLGEWLAADRAAYGVVDISAAKTEDQAMDALARLTKTMEKQYTGTKNARKVPLMEDVTNVREAEERLEKAHERRREAQDELRKAQMRLREAEEELMRAKGPLED